MQKRAGLAAASCESIRKEQKTRESQMAAFLHTQTNQLNGSMGEVFTSFSRIWKQRFRHE